MGKRKTTGRPLLEPPRSFVRDGITLEQFYERLNREAKPESLPHGGVLRFQMGDDDTGEGPARAIRAMLNRGERMLSGEEPVGEDVEVIPGSKIEMFDLWDIETAEYLVVWRIPCRNRVAHS